MGESGWRGGLQCATEKRRMGSSEGSRATGQRSRSRRGAGDIRVRSRGSWLCSLPLLLGRSQPRGERCPVPWSIRPLGSDGRLGANLAVATEGITLLYCCICLLRWSRFLWWLKLMHRGTVVSCSDISWCFQLKGGKPGWQCHAVPQQESSACLAEPSQHPSLLRALLRYPLAAPQ